MEQDLEITGGGVGNVAKSSFRRAARQNRYVLAVENIFGEVGGHALVVKFHSRTVIVERAHDTNRHVVNLREIFAKRFAEAFRFVVAGTRPRRAHIAVVLFVSRNFFGRRIAVNFTRRKK